MGEHDGHRARLRERFFRGELDDTRLLELLLCYAIRRGDVYPAAAGLIERFGSLAAVFEASPEELMQVRGIGESTAVFLLAAAAFIRRARPLASPSHTLHQPPAAQKSAHPLATRAGPGTGNVRNEILAQAPAQPPAAGAAQAQETTQAPVPVAAAAYNVRRLVPGGRRGAEVEKVLSAEDAGALMAPFFRECGDELLAAACLSEDRRVLAADVLARGDGRSVDVAFEIIRDYAARHNARYLLLAHNHPSALAIPSIEDRRSTQLLERELRRDGIELLDHLIMGGDDYVSLRDDGALV